MKKRAAAIVGAVGIVLVGLTGGAIWLGEAMRAAVNDVTDPAMYSSLRASLGPRLSPGAAKGLAYFPSAIPTSAVGLKFFYRPAFLQGGTVLQLRYELPHPQIVSAESAFNRLARFKGPASEHMFQHFNALKSTAAPLFRNEDNTAFVPLPRDFIVYVVDVGGFQSPDVDSGFLYGAAINSARNEIIYWLEDW